MKNKHKQLYVAVQDLLIGLGINPEELKALALNKRTCTAYRGIITPEIAQKLIDAGLIVEKVNWREPYVEDKTEINDHISKDAVLLTFEKVKSSLPPGILWSYLREKRPDFLHEQIKDYLFPGC